MTPKQCRAARALLGWDQKRLSSEARVGLSTLRDFERDKRTPIANNLAAMRDALGRYGVLLAEDESEGVALGDAAQRGRRT